MKNTKTTYKPQIKYQLQQKLKTIRTTSFNNSELHAELIYDKEEDKLLYAIYDKENNNVIYESRITLIMKDNKTGETHPIIIEPPKIDLIEKGVILLPSKASKYKDEKTLLKNIQNFIHKYMDIEEQFEKLCAYYVMFTWVYDRFNETPYLRALGDYGTGKTRFLQTLGALCYKSTFTSGATTPAPIYRINEMFHGTLILDEADLKYSDSKSDYIKILNCGYMKGMPVIRCEQETMNPQSFDVFCPKLIATRHRFEDSALESRCITVILMKTKAREDVPRNLSDGFWDEAQTIRNQLLAFRFKHYDQTELKIKYANTNIEDRIRQISTPLLSTIEDKSIRTEINMFLEEYNEEIIQDRKSTYTGEILEIICKLLGEKKSIMVRDVANEFNLNRDVEDKLSNRKIGGIIRNMLNLSTIRKTAGYEITYTKKKLYQLIKRYNITGYQEGLV